MSGETAARRRSMAAARRRLPLALLLASIPGTPSFQPTRTAHAPPRRLRAPPPSRHALFLCGKEESSAPPPPPDLFSIQSVDHSTLVEALTDKARLDALRLCDYSHLPYDPNQFFRTALHLKGRNLKLILPALVSLLAWGVLCSLVLPRTPRLRVRIEVLEIVSRSLLPPVSFLLVFRIGRAATRFWDARSALGRLILECRTACSTSTVAFASCPELLDRFLRWLAVYPIVVKNFLRKRHRGRELRMQELQPLLTEGEATAVLASEWGPIIVLDELRRLAFIASSRAASETAVRSQCYRALNSGIDQLTAAWSTMERIDNTPLPFVYVAHLRTILLLYLYVLFVTTIAQLGGLVLPGLLASSWALLGIEAAAVECSSPFQCKPNHLLFGRTSIIIAEGMAQTLKSRSEI
ncbi:hypothetical protein AB1Y20_010284 [Prymnesium parvum]|uniref:Bestrophin homolog n=1 Tax=Prymnesium parvum TaxID=97485 RepID=A0AB34K387_PRYPA